MWGCHSRTKAPLHTVPTHRKLLYTQYPLTESSSTHSTHSQKAPPRTVPAHRKLSVNCYRWNFYHQQSSFYLPWALSLPSPLLYSLDTSLFPQNVEQSQGHRTHPINNNSYHLLNINSVLTSLLVQTLAQTLTSTARGNCSTPSS